MGAMKSLEELKALRDKLKGDVSLREEAEDHIKILVGMATCGIAAGARETFGAMREEAEKLGLKDVTFTQTGCMGSCYAEPTVEVVFPNHAPVLYGNVTADKGREIIQKHIAKGELVQNLIIGKPF